MKENKQEIDILTDTLLFLIFTLYRINRGEVTQNEAEELLFFCMGQLSPLGGKRIKEILGQLN